MEKSVFNSFKGDFIEILITTIRKVLGLAEVFRFPHNSLIW
jgi:hypothetical protein